MRERKINRDNLEEWFFDYCEGNLSARERQEVESFVARHDHYQDELKCWQEAYLTPPSDMPLPEEARALLRQEADASGRSYRILPVLLTLLFAGLVSGVKDTPSGQKIFPLQSTVAPGSAQIFPAENNSVYLRNGKITGKEEHHVFTPTSAGKEESVTALRPPVSTDREVGRPDTDSEIMSHPPEAGSETKAVQDDDTAQAVIVSESQVTQSADASASKEQSLSRAEQRKINRNMRKAAQRREQQKFMKGGEPYIVPVDKTLF